MCMINFFATITNLPPDSKPVQLDNEKVKSQNFGSRTSGLNVQERDVNVELNVLARLKITVKRNNQFHEREF